MLFKPVGLTRVVSVRVCVWSGIACVYMHVCVCVCVHAYVSECIYMYVCMCACMRMRV